MDIQEIKDNNATVKASLKKHNQEVKSLLANPDVASWRKVDFKKHSKDLENLGLPVKDILASITTSQKLAENFLKETRVLMNAIANLQADLIGKLDESQITSDSQKVNKLHERITNNCNIFSSKANYLIEARKQFNNNLSLKGLLKFAGKKTKDKEFFQSGIEVYDFFLEDQTIETSEASLTDYENIVDKLEIRLKSIETSGLPNLTEEVVHHQIELGIQTLKQTSAFLHTVGTRFNTELATKGLLKQKVSNLQSAQSVSAALIDIKTIIDSLNELILQLATKKDLLEHIHRVPKTNEFINVLHLTIKNSLLPQMATDVAAESPINPVIIAGKSTKTFFSGLKGVMHSLKMMYSSMKGHDALNSMELQLIIEKAINSCRVFYGTSVDDVKKLSDMISALLENYDRPFPYEPLFKLVKSTLANYGRDVEKYIDAFKIDEKYREVKEVKIPKSFGKLILEIEQCDNDFKKIVNGML